MWFRADDTQVDIQEDYRNQLSIRRVDWLTCLTASVWAHIST